MKAETLKNVTTIRLTELKALDPVTVHFENAGPGSGGITVTCYGKAWCSWFGAMGDRTIEQFVPHAGTPYLVEKMQGQPRPKAADKAYLTRIVDAVVEYMKQVPETQA